MLETTERGAQPGTRLGRAATRPVSSASVALFRIAFGIAMVINTALYLPVLVREYYVDTTFSFPYGPLTFVAPLPGAGMYLVYVAMGVAGVLIALGAWYRWATAAFLVLHTYVFLVDSTFFQNHEYLIALVALLLLLLPVDGRWSVDARNHPHLRSDVVPAWVLWLLRFQVAIPYVYGGIAKLNPDWLRGEPLRMWLAQRTDIGPIDAVLTNDTVVWVMAYGALVLDLAVVPLLLHPRTRLPAFVVVTGFHLLNVWLFGLFIFPWLMIAATTLFFDPDWPERFRRRWLDAERSQPTPAIAPGPTLEPAAPQVPATGTARRWWAPSPVVVAVLALWVVLQVGLPLRHYTWTGSPSWTEEHHRFAWHMKLRDKQGTVAFVVSTPDGQTVRVDPYERLGVKQAGRLAGHPERLVHFARHLSAEHGGAEVRAETSVSLNGRAPQPIVDPTVDLAAQPLVRLRPAPWILPLAEPPVRSR